MATKTIVYAAGTSTWYAPQGVTSATVRLWGGGGAGGGLTVDNTIARGGGGAGGQYAESNVSVTPGTSYSVVVGGTRSGGTGNGSAGNDSTFASTVVVAKGGEGGKGYATAGQAGGVGSITNGVGDTVRPGGDGSAGGTDSTGGAGGGGAGTTNDGGDASGNTAGAGGATSGGNGGAGRTTSANGYSGTAAGGGGGGGANVANNLTTNRSGGIGAAGRGEITYTLSSASSISDNFNDNSIDAAKWNNWGGGQVTESSGSIHINTTTASAYFGIETLSPYDMTGSYFLVELVNAGDPSLASRETEFSVYLDVNNRVFFNVSAYDDTISAYKEISGSNTNLASTAYNATNHKWLKIRESGGTTYWETSTDGTSWSTFHSVANPIAVTSVQCDLICGTWDTETATTSCTFDNFNTPPTSGPTGVKTINGTAIASVKTVNATAIASVKTIQ